MKNLNTLKKLFLAGLLFVPLPNVAKANLIANGGFTAPETITGSGGQVSSIPDWPFGNVSASIGINGMNGYNVFGPYYATSYEDNDGNSYSDFVFLQNSASAGGVTSISQTFSVTAGDTYSLTFDVAGRNSYDSGGMAYVSFGDSSGDGATPFTALTSPGSSYTTSFQFETLTFTARTTSTGKVLLENEGTTADNTVDYTNINVEAKAAPEPSAYSLMVLGFGLLALFSRRRLKFSGSSV